MTEGRKVLRAQAEHSALILIHLKGAHFDPGIVAGVKQSIKEDSVYVKRIAYFGVSNAQRIVVVIFSKMVSYPIKIFDTLQEAKDWLVQD